MKHLWIAVAAAALLAAPAMAANAPQTADTAQHEKWTPPKTRQEAIERKQKQLDKLKAMSDAEWNQREAEYKQRYQQRMQRRRGMGNSAPQAPQQ